MFLCFDKPEKPHVNEIKMDTVGEKSDEPKGPRGGGGGGGARPPPGPGPVV